MRLEQAYDNLPNEFKQAFDKWCEDAQNIVGGSDIIENINSERQLEIDVFTEFLDCIALSYKDNADAKSAYENSCGEYRFHFKGIISKVSTSTVLHRVLNLKDLKEIIYQAMRSSGDGPDDAERAWDRFQKLTEEEQKEILFDAGLYPLQGIFWAYFDEKDAERGTKVDPLTGKSADECCNMLGIPTEWDKYDYGEHIWKIHYCPSRAVSRHIPTIADASAIGWNPYFQPAAEDRMSAKWGRTCPLGDYEETQGMPEVVHKGWYSGTEQGAFCALPEEVGIR